MIVENALELFHDRDARSRSRNSNGRRMLRGAGAERRAPLRATKCPESLDVADGMEHVSEARSDRFT